DRKHRKPLFEFRQQNIPGCRCDHPSHERRCSMKTRFSQHTEWLSLIDRTGPFLAVGCLEGAFPQGLDKTATSIRQRVRAAYDEWREAVDAEDPQVEA